MSILKISANSKPAAVAGAAAALIREGTQVEMQAVGAGAVNQAVKAAAIAREMLLKEKADMVCRPEFFNVTIGDDVKSGIRIVCTIIEK